MKPSSQRRTLARGGSTMPKDKLAGVAPEPAAVIAWGGWTVAAGLILILAQLVSEVFVRNRFGPNYVGLFVVMIGAALMAFACLASCLPSKIKPEPEKAE